MATELFEYYKKIVEEYRKKILEAEELKRDPEFQKALHYFRGMRRDGLIKTAPSLRNKYRLETLGDDYGKRQ